MHNDNQFYVCGILVHLSKLLLRKNIYQYLNDLQDIYQYVTGISSKSFKW